MATMLNEADEPMQAINDGAQRLGLADSLSSQPGEGGANFLDFLILVASKKKTVLAITGTATVLALIISLLLPKWYTAEVLVLPPQQGSSLATALVSQMSNLGSLASMAGSSLGLKNPADLYVSILRSEAVEDAMIERFDLRREYGKKTFVDTRKKFEAHTIVVSSSKDGLIRISVEARDPNHAAAMANAYVEELRKVTANLAITEASQRRMFFERQLESTKEQLAKAEDDLKQTQLRTGLIQIDGQARALIESAAALRAQVAAKEVQIQSMRSFATDQNPELQIALRQLAALQTQLDRLTGTRSLSKDDVFVPKGSVPEAGLEYLRKMREFKYQEMLFELLARQLELAKLDEAREGAIVQTVSQAVAPDKRSFPKRGIIVSITFILSVGISLFWVLLLRSWQYALIDPVTSRKFKLLRQLLLRTTRGNLQ